jgi:glycosyltransferase involved in cell wall biosynthesis
MANELLSVVVPVYKAADTIETLLKSLCAQTYANIEILLVYLASDDDTLEKIKNVPDSRIKIIEQTERTGPGGARNMGVAAARGEWIGFAEADDFVELDFYEKLLSHVSAQTDIVWGGMMSHDKVTICHDKCDSCSSLEEKFGPLKNGACFDKIFRADFLRAYDIRFAEKIRWEDNIFVFKAFYYAQAIAVVPQVYYHYLPEPWNEKYRTTLHRDVVPAAREIVTFIQNLSLSQKQQNLLYYKMYCSFLCSFIGDPHIYRELYQLMGHPWFLKKCFWKCKFKQFKKRILQHIRKK